MFDKTIVTYDPKDWESLNNILKDYSATDIQVSQTLKEKGFFMTKSELKKKRKLEQVPEVIRQVARKAYAVVQQYYGWPDAMTGGDLDKSELHVQLSVIRDVRAVLLGNRTPEQLHENWRYRKLRSFYGPQVTKDNYASYCDIPPEFSTTIIEPWAVLTKYDKQGYEFFVETVKRTHEALTKEPVYVDKATLVEAAQKLDLRLAAKKVVEIHKSSLGGVSVYFNTSEDEENFIKVIEDAKR